VVSTYAGPDGDGVGLRVAADFTNDIVHVPSARVRRLLDPPAGVAAGHAVLAPGCRVEFSDPDAAPAVAPAAAHEVLLVAARAHEEEPYALYPLVIGRSTYPAPAADADAPALDDTELSLSRALVAAADGALGRLAANAYHRRAARAAWADRYTPPTSICTHPTHTCHSPHM